MVSLTRARRMSCFPTRPAQVGWFEAGCNLFIRLCSRNADPAAQRWFSEWIRSQSAWDKQLWCREGSWKGHHITTTWPSQPFSREELIWGHRPLSLPINWVPHRATLPLKQGREPQAPASLTGRWRNHRPQYIFTDRADIGLLPKGGNWGRASHCSSSQMAQAPHHPTAPGTAVHVFPANPSNLCF